LNHLEEPNLLSKYYLILNQQLILSSILKEQKEKSAKGEQEGGKLVAKDKFKVTHSYIFLPLIFF